MSPESINPTPFSEPPWLSGYASPYYTEFHRRFQRACRAFLETHLTPHALSWEREEQVPQTLYRTFADANMLVPALPAPLPVKWLRKLGMGEMLGGVGAEEWDYVHTGIYISEVFHCAKWARKVAGHVY